MPEPLVIAFRDNYAEQRAVRAALRDLYRERRNERAQWAARLAAGGRPPSGGFTCRGTAHCPRSFAEHQAQAAQRTPAGGRPWNPIGAITRREP